MVVNKNGTIDQITHYYPYGELMADISTNPTKQEFKYGGKELDRTFGLDLYDYHARQQDSKLGCFTSIDPLAEKYYGISPYAYCAGDPVNLVDPDGRWIQCAVGAAIGGIVDAGIAIYNNKSATEVTLAFCKGAANGALAASGMGILMSVVGSAAIEYTNQFVECALGVDDDFSLSEITEATVLGGIGTTLNKVPLKKIEQIVKKQVNSKAAVSSSKQAAKAKLTKEAAEGTHNKKVNSNKTKKPSTSNDPKVKDKAKQMREEKEDILNGAATITINSSEQLIIDSNNK